MGQCTQCAGPEEDLRNQYLEDQQVVSVCIVAVANKLTEEQCAEWTKKASKSGDSDK